MPGIAKFGNITMKRGVFVNDNTFWNWHAEIKMNTVKRRTVLIKLLDESGGVTMQWQLDNAWPTKITSTDLKSDGNEVAVDTIEIAHEQITIKNGK
jgi:phage tail-like protein